MVSKLRIVLKRTRSTKEKAELEVEREQAAGARAALEQLLTRSRRATARAERKVQELLSVWQLGTLQLSAESAGHDAGRMHVAASVSDEEEQDGGGGGRKTTPLLLSPAALAGCVLKVAIVADDNELATAATAAESAKRALF